MSEKRLVIFDLDNTLVINRPAVKKAYASALRFIAKESNLDFNKIHNHWKRIVQKIVTDMDPLKRTFEYSLGLLLEEHRVADVLIPPALKIFEKDLLAEMRPLAGAKEVLSWLKEQKCQIAVVAGTDRSIAKKKLKITELLPFIDLIVSASDVGAMKPHPDYIKTVLENFDAKPTQAIVISDSKKEDLEQASQLGVKTILIATTNPQLTALKPELSEFLSYAQ